MTPKMKYEEKSFSVNVGDTEAYRRNYDRIFRNKRRKLKKESEGKK